MPYTDDARYIAVVRDPKDVCVSGYHFLRSMLWGPLAPSVERWVDYFREVTTFAIVPPDVESSVDYMIDTGIAADLIIFHSIQR